MATNDYDPAAEKAAGQSPRLSVLAHALGLWKACRPWVFRATLLLTVGIACLVLVIRFRAESNLLTVFLSYLPPWVVAVPFLGTLFFGVLFACWRSTLLSLVAPVVVTLWLGAYALGGGSAPAEGGGAAFTVITYNRGQGSDSALTSFVGQLPPDVAVFQDAGRRLARLSALPEFAGHPHGFQDGEFAIISRWPLLQNESLQLAWPEAPSGIFRAGTRSVIDWNGKRVVVYNIHLPTPRDLLYWYGQRGTFLYGLLGLVPFTPLHARHQDYLATWKARVGLVSQLVARVQVESDPVILLGDLNLPPAGQAYQEVVSTLQDAHAASGNGFGHTFPGNMKSLARRFAPWIRIDHIFFSSHWVAESCSVSRVHQSQHLPVGARLRSLEFTQNQP